MDTKEEPQKTSNERFHWLRPRVLLSTVRKNAEWSTVALLVLLAVIWCLLLLPVVFFGVDTNEGTTNDQEPGPTSCDDHMISFTSSICSIYMEKLQRCSADNATGDGSQLPILTTSGSQVKVERSILGVLALLGQLNASEKCLSHAYSFACQYFYPTCTPMNNSIKVHFPPADHCYALLTHCARTLQHLQPSVATQLLPDCALLPNDNVLRDLSCSGNETSDLPVLTTTMTCKDDFTLVDGICLARCDSWESVSHSDIQNERISVIFACIVAFLGCTAVLSVSLYRRKTVCVFPSVFVVYHTLACAPIAIVVLVNYMDQDALYCTEETVVGALENPSPFCTISGVIWNYCFLNLTWWWFLHVCCVFWKVMFPIHARAYQRRHTYIHITLVAIGLVLPVSSIVAAFATGGYSISGFPPLLCAFKDQNADYISRWLVVNLLLLGGITMLVILTWRVHKHQGFFSEKKSATKFKLTTAEKKLIFVFSYYIVFAVLTLVYYSLTYGDLDKFLDAAREYFKCEATGHNPDNPCPKSYEQYKYPQVGATVYILMGFIPVMNLVFVVNSVALENAVSKVLVKLHCIAPRDSFSVSTSNTHDRNP